MVVAGVFTQRFVDSLSLSLSAYLTGAPLLWAGLSSTVTVLSVWFRDVSWSYAGMDGAEKKEEEKTHLTKFTPASSHPQLLSSAL